MQFWDGIARHGEQVGEVPCLGPAEHGEHLVDRELLGGEHGAVRTGHGREETDVGRQVDLGQVTLELDLETDESVGLTDPSNSEPSFDEGGFDNRCQPVGVVACAAEVVEVPRQAVDLTGGNEGGTAGKGEVLRLGQADLGTRRERGELSRAVLGVGDRADRRGGVHHDVAVEAHRQTGRRREPPVRDGAARLGA